MPQAMLAGSSWACARTLYVETTRTAVISTTDANSSEVANSCRLGREELFLTGPRVRSLFHDRIVDNARGDIQTALQLSVSQVIGAVSREATAYWIGPRVRVAFDMDRK